MGVRGQVVGGGGAKEVHTEGFVRRMNRSSSSSVLFVGTWRRSFRAFQTDLSSSNWMEESTPKTIILTNAKNEAAPATGVSDP